MGVYTTLEAVSRKLRSTRGEKVRFSKSLVSAHVHDGSRNKAPVLDFYVDPEEIVYNQEFDEKVSLKFEFTSTTEFDIFKADHGGKFSKKIGSGDTSTQLVYDNGSLIFPTTVWSGTPAVGTVVSLKFAPDLSDFVAEEYISDAQIVIDSMLLDSDIGLEMDGVTIFTATTVPTQLELAATLLSAYMIFSDTFQTKVSNEDSGCGSQVKRWKDMAEKLIRLYISSQKKAGDIPTISTFMPSVNKIGIPDVNGGMHGPIESVDDIDASEFGNEDLMDEVYK